MLRRPLNKQKGFTLIEVALAIALGIIIVIAAILGYNSVRTAQAEREARNRLGALKGIIEQYSAANNGAVPALTQLRTLWSDRRKEDFMYSPWGGVAGGAVADAGITAGVSQQVTPGNVTSTLQGRIGYVSSPGISFTNYDKAVDTTVTHRNYEIYYHDKGGTGPWFVTGGDL